MGVAVAVINMAVVVDVSVDVTVGMALGVSNQWALHLAILYPSPFLISIQSLSLKADAVPFSGADTFPFS